MARGIVKGGNNDGAVIRLVQSGETLMTSNATEVTLTTPIDITKSIVIITVLQHTTSTSTTVKHLCVKPVLSGTNALTFYTNTYLLGSSPYVSWEVITFVNAKPKQTGEIASVNGTKTATLATAVSSKAILVVSSTNSATTNSTSFYVYEFDAVITDSTTITFRAFHTGHTIRYEVIDF